jgi:hypothetical protein
MNMTDKLPKPCDALVRCLDQSGLPDYATTYGTELCIVPQLIALSQALAEEAEQEIISDLGANEGIDHPQYSEGFDAGLRHAAAAIRRLFDVV